MRFNKKFNRLYNALYDFENLQSICLNKKNQQTFKKV